MSTNIVFKIKDNAITISEIKKDINYKSLNQTNIFNINDLKFSTEYIEKNIKIVASFLNVIILKNKINTIKISHNSYASLVMDLVNEWSSITKIVFLHDKKISIDIFMKLLENKYITDLECYEIDNYLMDRLYVNKNLTVKTRSIVKFESEFMHDNFLNNYSAIFYKKMIAINHELKNEDIEDLKTFLTINTKLKQIKILKYNENTIKLLVGLLKEYNYKDILIIINEKNNDLGSIYNDIGSLKKQKRSFFKKNNIKFKINYSFEYKYNNYLKQINFKTLRTIMMMIIFLSLGLAITTSIQQHNSDVLMDTELDNIGTIIEDFDNLFEEDDDTPVYDDNDDTEEIDTTSTSNKNDNISTAYTTKYSQVWDSLLDINDETVGWLKVNNTKINYPVVQNKKSNDYYLNHDFNKNKNSFGWLFADYRDNTITLSDNIIIYGHNLSKSHGYKMFGSLHNALNEKWYTNKDNWIITFNTPTKNMKWQIFSIYVVPKTSDYLRTKFSSVDEKMEFLNMLKNRSIYDFGVTLNKDSKILTLSTCNKHINRTVVHAVLIEETDTTEKATTNVETSTTTSISLTTSTTQITTTIPSITEAVENKTNETKIEEQIDKEDTEQ